MATKPSCPQHIGNRLKPNAQTHTLKRQSAPTLNLLSNNLFDTNTVLVRGWAVNNGNISDNHFRALTALPTAHIGDVNSVHLSTNLGPVSVAG